MTIDSVSGSQQNISISNQSLQSQSLNIDESFGKFLVNKIDEPNEMSADELNSLEDAEFLNKINETVNKIIENDIKNQNTINPIDGANWAGRENKLFGQL